MQEIMMAIIKEKLQVMALTPNADTGNHEIRTILEAHSNYNHLHIQINLSRKLFLSWMNAVEMMIGNSSSGIIEAASYNLPVINIGSRQHLREHGENILHCSTDNKNNYRCHQKSAGTRQKNVHKHLW